MNRYMGLILICSLIKSSLIISCSDKKTNDYLKIYNSIYGVIIEKTGSFRLKDEGDNGFGINITKLAEINNNDIQYLPEIKRLYDIVIESDNITEEGIKYVGLCKDLETLTIKGKRIDDRCIKHLTGLKKLMILNLSGNKNLTDESLKYIGQIEGLDTINVSETSITDKGLSYLKNIKDLTYLNLSGCKNITVESLKYLAENKYLKKDREYDTCTVNYEGTKVTRDEAEKLIQEYGLKIWIETDEDGQPGIQ